MEVKLLRHFYLILTVSLGFPHFKVEGAEHDRGQVNLTQVNSHIKEGVDLAFRLGIESTCM